MQLAVYSCLSNISSFLNICFILLYCSLHTPCFLLPSSQSFLVLFANIFPYGIPSKQMLLGVLFSSQSICSLTLPWQCCSSQSPPISDKVQNYISRPHLSLRLQSCIFSDFLWVFVRVSWAFQIEHILPYFYTCIIFKSLFPPFLHPLNHHILLILLLNIFQNHFLYDLLYCQSLGKAATIS